MNKKRSTLSLGGSSSSSTYLPARIIAACLEFALDAQDIARAQSVCRGWRLPENLVDRLFHTRYLQQFEARTANTQMIARAGATTTPWKTRFRRRLQVRRNWEGGRYKTSSVKLPITDIPQSVLIVPATDLVLVWSSFQCLSLVCTTDGREVARSTTPVDKYLKKQVATNGRSVFCIPSNEEDKKIVELRIPDLQPTHSYTLPRCARRICVDDAILVSIDSSIHDYQVHVWNTEQKQLLYTLSIGLTISVLDCALDVARNTLMIAARQLLWDSAQADRVERYDLKDGKKGISSSLEHIDAIHLSHKHGLFWVDHVTMCMMAYDLTSLVPLRSAGFLRTPDFTRVTDDHILQYSPYHPRSQEIQIRSTSDCAVQFPSINLARCPDFTDVASYSCLQSDAFRVMLCRGNVLYMFDFASMSLE